MPGTCSEVRYSSLRETSPLSEKSFFPDGSVTPIPVSKLAKNLGVQTDNMFSRSAQCTEAANNERRLIFMIRRSFQDLSKSAFIALYGALVRPHLEYGIPACSPNLVAGIKHLERIQSLATRLRDDLIAAFKIFKGLLDIDPNLFFLPPARRGLRGHPLQGTPRCEPPPKERVGIFGEGCEILE